MPTTEIDEQTAAEWRELGFFYESDAAKKVWVLVGSKSGLHRFRDLLLAYATDRRNQRAGEHAHYGPYSYLKVTTSGRSGIDSDGIHGPPEEIRRFAEIVGATLEDARPDTSTRIDLEYTGECEFSMVLQLRADDFDPASADAALGFE
jgi:hypothetical protein